MPTWVSDWPSPPCCQSSLARSHVFLQCVLDLLCCFCTHNHISCLNSEFQLHLHWWRYFPISCHGVSLGLFPGMSAPTDVEVTSDPVGSLCFGAYYNKEWFSSVWVPSEADQSIAYKELFPVVVASHVWGSQWFQRHVLFRSDNKAVVHILIARPSKVLCIMHGTTSPGSNRSSTLGVLDPSSPELQCQNFLVQGLGSSTHSTYLSGQKKFYDFCTQFGKIHQSGSPWPTDDWTLCLVAKFLAKSVQHSTIKVYLSLVHLLHIEQGLGDPLVDCLQLQPVLTGIKRTKGDTSSSCCLVTDDIMMVIFRALDLSLPDHCMFWAACTLAYFGPSEYKQFLGNRVRKIKEKESVIWRHVPTRDNPIDLGSQGGPIYKENMLWWEDQTDWSIQLAVTTARVFDKNRSRRWGYSLNWRHDLEVG